MKKSVLILLTFVPLIIGYLTYVNTYTMYGTRSVKYYLLILLSTVFWFFLGMLYTRSNWKPIISVLIAHAVFIFSILVYWWQSSIMFNPSLVSLSRLFTASTPIVFISEKIAEFLDLNTGVVWTMERHIGLQLLALVYMIIVFCFGMHFWKKQKSKV